MGKNNNLLDKTELIDTIRVQTGLTEAQIESVLDAQAGAFKSYFKEGKKVVLPGLGRLNAKKKKGRYYRNPKTGEPVYKGAHLSVSFNASKALEAVLASVEVLFFLF